MLGPLWWGLGLGVLLLLGHLVFMISVAAALGSDGQRPPTGTDDDAICVAGPTSAGFLTQQQQQFNNVSDGASSMPPFPPIVKTEATWNVQPPAFSAFSLSTTATIPPHGPRRLYQL